MGQVVGLSFDSENTTSGGAKSDKGIGDSLYAGFVRYCQSGNRGRPLEAPDSMHNYYIGVSACMDTCVEAKAILNSAKAVSCYYKRRVRSQIAARAKWVGDLEEERRRD